MIKVQVEAAFTRLTGAQVYTRGAQMDILNVSIAVATKFPKKNLSLKELIDGRTKPVQNMMLQLVMHADLAPPSNSAATDGVVRETPSTFLIAEAFFGGKRKRGCRGCNKIDCPGWYDNKSKIVFLTHKDNSACTELACAKRSAHIGKYKKHAG